MVTIRVDNRLRVQLADLPEDVVGQVRRKCTYANPAFKKMAQFIARHPKGRFMKNNEPEQLRTFVQEGAGLSLPRGAMPVLRAALRSARLQWHVDDQRTEGNPQLRPDPMQHRAGPNGEPLRWYQEEAVEEACRKQNCLLRAPTGSGKTTTALAIIARLRLPTLIIVWSGALLEQWRERIVRELGVPAESIGQLGAGKRTVKPITLAMQQSLVRLPDSIVSQFGLVLCDEVQRFAARTFFDVIDRFPAKYRIGVSADETRKDRKEFLTYDVFGDVAHEVTQDELIRDGAVLDVECRVVPTDFRADWYVQQLQSGLATDTKRLLDEMVADEQRALQVVQLVQREVDDGQQVLVLSHRVEHCKTLAALLRERGVQVGLMLGGAAAAAEMADTCAGLRAKTLQVGVGTVQAVGTGLDIPAISRGVLATPIGSNRQLYGQIRGRMCRVGKEDAVLFVLWDQHVAGVTQVQNLARWNRAMKVLHDGALVDGRAFIKTWKETDDAADSDRNLG